MKNAGVSASQLAERLGMSYQAVKKVIDGKSSAFNAANNSTASRVLTVSPDWLATGEGPMTRDGVAATEPWVFPDIPEKEVRGLPPAQLTSLQEAMKAAIRVMQLGITLAPGPTVPRSRNSAADSDEEMAFPPLGPDIAPPWNGGKTTFQSEQEELRVSRDMHVIVNVAAGEVHAANDKYEKVAMLSDVRLAAGSGIENESELATGIIQFRQSFLRSVNADGGRGRVVYAKGDSMEPVIQDGAALLVVPDEGLTLRDLAPGSVYAINYDGKMIVKAIVRDRLTKHWMARSLNARYPDIPLEGEVSVRVLGRVVWVGSRLRGNNGEQWILRR